MVNVTLCHPLLQDLKNSSVPPKYKKQKMSGKDTAKPLKVRNQNVSEFVLRLTSHVVYGEGTLMVCFLLDPWARDSSPIQGQVLMVWNKNQSILVQLMYFSDSWYRSTYLQMHCHTYHAQHTQHTHTHATRTYHTHTHTQIHTHYCIVCKLHQL